MQNYPINSLHSLLLTFLTRMTSVTTDELTLTNHHHPKSIVHISIYFVQSVVWTSPQWLVPSSLYHRVYFHCHQNPLYSTYSTLCTLTLTTYICVCVCVFIYIYLNTHTHTHTYIYIYIFFFFLPCQECNFTQNVKILESYVCNIFSLVSDYFYGEKYFIQLCIVLVI